LTKQEFLKLIVKNGACKDSIPWVESQEVETFQEGWEICERADYMLWLLAKMSDKPGWPSKNEVILACCDCAETALKFIPEGEERPKKAIETTRLYIKNKASIQDVRIAADAAYAYAADAADAYAADAAVAYAYAAYAAAYADAYTSAAYASATYAAAYADAYTSAAYASAAYAADASAAYAAAYADAAYTSAAYASAAYAADAAYTSAAYAGRKKAMKTMADIIRNRIKM
jgi:hypothetical protein